MGREGMTRHETRWNLLDGALKSNGKKEKKPTKQNSRLRINLINGDDLFLHVQLDCFCTNLEREQNILKDLLAISHF